MPQNTFRYFRNETYSLSLKYALRRMFPYSHSVILVWIKLVFLWDGIQNLAQILIAWPSCSQIKAAGNTHTAPLLSLRLSVRERFPCCPREVWRWAHTLHFYTFTHLSPNRRAVSLGEQVSQMRSLQYVCVVKTPEIPGWDVNRSVHSKASLSGFGFIMWGSSVTQMSSFPWYDCLFVRWKWLREKPEVSATVERVKRASSMRADNSNLATVLMFLQMCTTYPVTSKQLRTKT